MRKTRRMSHGVFFQSSPSLPPRRRSRQREMERRCLSAWYRMLFVYGRTRSFFICHHREFKWFIGVNYSLILSAFRNWFKYVFFFFSPRVKRILWISIAQRYQKAVRSAWYPRLTKKQRDIIGMIRFTSLFLVIARTSDCIPSRCENSHRIWSRDIFPLFPDSAG